MKQGSKITEKIFTKDQMIAQLKRWKLLSKTISFTNGVFDILHEGHIKLLTQAASYADILIVGINSDASVKRLKGDARPVNNEFSRAIIMASLVMTDAVIIFEEDTPLELIKTIMPGVLVKGGDYTVANIVGAKEIIANNGKVEIIPLQTGFSTTGIIEKMKNL
ncbi:MAG: D-glycero-beta-D-manno-heptose 1-phosphate adenylyltransferase [Bacteroidota bacterium]|nr:D-glycero-beta-D-manno-heptose 1-phosphate adenylyltransferase [Bacteroidota bacterium]